MKSNFETEIQNHGFIIYTNVGTSMLPLIHQHKDLLIIEKPPERLKKYDIPLYKRDNNQYVLHRVLKVRPDDYVICGDNLWKREYGITDKHVIGILTAIVKNGKKISIDCKKYKLYAHIWCDFFIIRASILWIRDLPKRIKRKLKKL